MSIMCDKEAAVLAFDECGVPIHIREALMAYCLEHRPVGGFLTAVLSNDLKEAFAAADDENAANLHVIVKWLYWHAPGRAWGSPEKVKEWLEAKP